MPLTQKQHNHLVEFMTRGSTAGAALPLIRELVSKDQIDDVPEAIDAAVQLMEVNRAIGRRYLANRLPAIVFNYLSTKVVDAAAVSKIMEATIDDETWADRIRSCAANRDGEGLAAVMEELLAIARSK